MIDKVIRRSRHAANLPAIRRFVYSSQRVTCGRQIDPARGRAGPKISVPESRPIIRCIPDLVRAVRRPNVRIRKPRRVEINRSLRRCPKKRMREIIAMRALSADHAICRRVKPGGKTCAIPPPGFASGYRSWLVNGTQTRAMLESVPVR